MEASIYTKEDTKMPDWIDNVVARIETASNGVLEFEIDGNKISTTLGVDIVRYLKDNKPMLLRMGQTVFRNFLLLIHAKRNEDAFNLLLLHMDADDIIAKMQMNADQLNEYNTNRDNFVESLKKFALQLLTSTASKLLVGLII